MRTPARFILPALLVVGLIGPATHASAAKTPKDFYTADFRNGTDVQSPACAVVNTSRTFSLRVTNISKKKGSFIQTTVDSTFNPVELVETSVSNPGWSTAHNGSLITLTGTAKKSEIKKGGFIQFNVTATPTQVGTFTWPTRLDEKPGKTGKLALTGGQPTVQVVQNAGDSCGTGGTGVTQSGAGTPCVSPTITGSAGDSLVIGTPGNDVILDLLGNNHIEGRGGNDIVCTGPGNDDVFTLGGNDIAFDQGGTNLIRTAAGSDHITTGRGNSRISAGNGTDVVSASTGRNNIRLGKGRDRATAQSGNDTIKGGGGRDTVSAGDGKNRLGGGNGRDSLRAGSGRDRLNGGKGTDTCRGDGGNNRFVGCEVRRGNGA